jgi:hypothetical protein
VRQPVTVTGMGRIVPLKDAAALAEAVIEVLHHPEQYHRPRKEIAARYSTGRTADDYERLFGGLVARNAQRTGHHRGHKTRAALAGTLAVALMAALLARRHGWP